ncbi:MAG: diacylglycerol kinase family protein [Pseudomonadota bacterium]
MHTQVLLNTHAGALINADVDAFSHALRERLQDAGHSVDVIATEAADIDARLREAALNDSIDRLIVGGGDGTIRSAAAKLMGTGKPLGIIPMGTLNRLARDLEMPLVPMQAVDALCRASVADIDTADVNGHVFLCQSLMGLPVLVAARRQKLRGKPLIARGWGMMRLLVDALQANRKKTISVRDENETQKLRALSLAVVLNEFSETASLMMKRQNLSDGQLVLYASKHKSGLQTAGAMVKALAGLFKDDPSLLIFDGSTFTVNSRRKRITLSNDGEIERTSFPLRYTIHPKSLKVLRPKPL